MLDAPTPPQPKIDRNGHVRNWGEISLWARFNDPTWCRASNANIPEEEKWKLLAAALLCAKHEALNNDCSLPRHMTVLVPEGTFPDPEPEPKFRIRIFGLTIEIK